MSRRGQLTFYFENYSIQYIHDQYQCRSRWLSETKEDFGRIAPEPHEMKEGKVLSLVFWFSELFFQFNDGFVLPCRSLRRKHPCSKNVLRKSETFVTYNTTCLVWKPKPRGFDISHLALAHKPTVLSKLRIKIPPNDGLSDWSW